MVQRSVFLFTHDLRLADNPALLQACHQSDALICCYWQPSAKGRDRFGNAFIGPAREQFVQQSLFALDQQLGRYGQWLEWIEGDITHLLHYLQLWQPQKLYASEAVALAAETTALMPLAVIEQALPELACETVASDCLLDSQYFTLGGESAFPPSYSQFRKHLDLTISPRHGADVSMAKLAELVPAPCGLPLSIPPSPFNRRQKPLLQQVSSAVDSAFSGGERQGLAQWQAYCHSDSWRDYPLLGYTLDGWANSSKLSPWLALGCIDVRRIWHDLAALEIATAEAHPDAPFPGQGLAAELWWREYFHHYSRMFPHAWRQLGGSGTSPVNGSFYPARFRQWCAGQTLWPLVNACMRQLNQTGYISNRARQIAASALINELGVDWRAGEGYFQQQLIDYDAAVNRGNWQYIAGALGHQGRKALDLVKQQARYDPQQQYIRLWADSTVWPLDEMDAADWPGGW